MPWSKTGGSKNHNKNAQGREILMIKVFNGDAFGIQEEEYDRNTLLQFFLDGHREDFILVYRGEKLLKALSYYDILFNREVPEKVLYMNPNVFIQARDLIYAYGREEDRWRRALAVCDDNGEVLCLLYYLENCTSTVCPVSDFKRYGCEGRTDLTLLSQAETWVFEELEEYTYFLCHALEHFFPEKRNGSWMKTPCFFRKPAGFMKRLLRILLSSRREIPCASTVISTKNSQGSPRPPVFSAAWTS